jgi:hypothetical protein
MVTGIYYIRQSCICLWDCSQLGLPPIWVYCLHDFVPGAHGFLGSGVRRELDTACMFSSTLLFLFICL